MKTRTRIVLLILILFYIPSTVILGQQEQKPIQPSPLIADTLYRGEQEIFSPSRSAIYVELLGQGLLYSVNYDYRITDHLSLRAGFSTWTIPSIFGLVDGEISFTGFPIMLNYLTGEGSSHLELGAGIIPANASVTGREIFFGSDVSGSETLILGTATIGYRLQPRDGGFLFRVGLVPLLGSGGLKFSTGLSLGAAF
ncbi:MAG: hypothetical protein HY033_08900 [Ignavibacteriae bacterium]|nr:hypothetical protein [Ignavibacteria bacterium]MBI3365009.1 hypothetical protein [Ignavibacteriota bacterium]